MAKWVNERKVHDISYLKQVRDLPVHKELPGDRAYISNGLQLDLFDQLKFGSRYLSDRISMLIESISAGYVPGTRWWKHFLLNGVIR